MSELINTNNVQPEQAIVASTANDVEDENQLALLPEPDEGTVEADSSSERVNRITVDGDQLKLDHLGPMIINEDGTVRRIANWQSLTEREQAVAWKRLADRNKRRKEELLIEQKIRDEEALAKRTASTNDESDNGK